jgi:2-keto-4-pentenoate hydratase/2-oxohepta-3-ene-1,7-dioic acid hydratase in catechol pathway
VNSSNAAGRPWALVTAAVAGSPATQVGIQVVGADEVRVPNFLRGLIGVLQVIDRWDELSQSLRALDPADGELLVDATVVLPLAYPRKVLCSGPNFYDHLAEMGESGLGEEWTGYFFFKPPTTSLIGPTDSVLVGANWSAGRVDWEGELAVVLARGGRDIPRSEALSYVAGYSVANDISLRGPYRRNTPAAPFVWDWVASKGADTSLPIGPGVVPAWLVPDPQQLKIRTWVNGDNKQDGTTADMVLDVASLIADASALVTLEPGDVILTGTPAGVGVSRGTFLAPGDVVDIEIPGVGRLHNVIEHRKGT